MTRPTRRRALAGAATIGTALLSGWTTDGESGDSDAEERPLRQSHPGASVEAALEYVERATEQHTRRPARGFRNKGQARLTYLTDRTSTPALREEIEHVAEAYATAIDAGAPISSLNCLVEYAAIGEAFYHSAEFEIRRFWALDYVRGATSRRTYHNRIYRTIEQFSPP
jgi:hypothetical protein